MSPDPNNTDTSEFIRPTCPKFDKTHTIIGKANQPVFRLTMSSLKIGSFLDAAHVWKGFWNMRARHGRKKSGGQALDSMKHLDQLRNSRNTVKAAQLPKGNQKCSPLARGNNPGLGGEASLIFPQHLWEQSWPLLGFKTNLVPEFSKNPIIEKEKSQRSMRSGGKNLPALSSCL